MLEKQFFIIIEVKKLFELDIFNVLPCTKFKLG